MHCKFRDFLMKNNMHKVSLFFMSLMVCTTVWGMKRPSSDLITRSQWKKKLEQSRDAKIASENDMIGELVSLPEPLTQPMNSASAPKNKKQLQCSECIFS